jgi:hypothetical protein
MNSFTLGAQVGGRLAKDASAQEQERRDMFNSWTGDYSSDVRESAFILRIDGEFHAIQRCGVSAEHRKQSANAIGSKSRSEYESVGGAPLTPTPERDALQVK